MRRMVLMGPVVLTLGALAACSNPLNNASASTSTTPTGSVTTVVIPTPTPTPTATKTVPQQTGEANPSPFVTPTVPDTTGAKPACTSVWVDGGTLPTAYHGCTGDSKADEHMLDCNTGPNLWIRNEPNSYEYFAFAGKEINHSKDPNADSAATGKCMS